MKTKEGGVMDMQEEREAFEIFYKSSESQYHKALDNYDTDFDCYPNDYIQCRYFYWQAAKAQAVPEGFVLISAEQLSQWGHMANYAEQYGCPECFEARGYAHSLACEINEFFAIEAQEPAK